MISIKVQPSECTLNRVMDNIKQLNQLGLFDAKVPRYTSYPTAPQFTTGIQAKEFEAWLRAVTPGSAISLYLHIPFCRRLCWFCACSTQGVSKDAPVLSYLKTLKDELAMVAAALPKDVTLSRLHWGGWHANDPVSRGYHFVGHCGSRGFTLSTCGRVFGRD